MVDPHGGTLVNNLAIAKERDELESLAGKMYNLKIDDRAASNCEMLANGGFSPLQAFMSHDELISVVDNMSLPGGLIWSIPVLLPVSPADFNKIEPGTEVALFDNQQRLIAVLSVSEKFNYDLEDYCRKVFKTTETTHPGVKAVMDAGNNFLAGKIKLVNHPLREKIAEHYYLSPAQTRALISEKGWKNIVAFQTRNPIHRAHEYLIKCVLEQYDAVLIHPLVGETKSDDIPADVRMKCYEVLTEKYFNKNNFLLSVLPAAMNYAGPREALHHMIIRQNYGCSHIIIGRDHAGVGAYYGTYEAQDFVTSFEDKLAIKPLKFEHTFYCNICGSMASSKTCPHPATEHLQLSGTKVREMLRDGKLPPKEFSRPEVAEALIEWAKK